MNFFRQCIAYLKDNPQGYWFKRKVFGWGWVPATWQGWAITAVYVVLVVALAATLDKYSTTNEVMFVFVLPVILLSVTFLRIAYKTGEPPKWQWGFPKKDEVEGE